MTFIQKFVNCAVCSHPTFPQNDLISETFHTTVNVSWQNQGTFFILDEEEPSKGHNDPGGQK
jgi:hypothetical protein